MPLATLFVLPYNCHRAFPAYTYLLSLISPQAGRYLVDVSAGLDVELGQMVLHGIQHL